jgi:hypothetical protein
MDYGLSSISIFFFTGHHSGKKGNFETYWAFTLQHGAEVFENNRYLAHKRAELDYFSGQSGSIA